MKTFLSISTFCLLFFTSCSDDLGQSSILEDLENEQKSIDSNGYISDNRTDGYNQGYFWTIYKEGGWGRLRFPYANQYGGNFEIEYKNNQDIVGGKGWSTGNGRRINYNIGLLQGSYNFVGVYGWTQTPLIEYYVVEKGSITGQNQNKNYTVNGKNYKFKKQLRSNAPSILGTKTFYQYISEHGNAPTGSNQQVHMQAHINHWNAHGGHKPQWGNLRNFDYQVFGIESYTGGWGKINASIW
ncbi:glycoside hydrolase family 11 protein [Aquimarina latercula]|uniref:glycoside hydrolase family 11 protein n=1 Tax=Aquimarina latercula TaxID=987 RepID=UPI0003FADBE8|nr:glycoside hydrolase family 11 protein [Aquimarina latercula]